MGDDNISKIKDRVDIVELISSYIKVQKAGINFKARCPFHNEKTPSFYISPERQIWHCFGCFPPGQKIKTPFGFHNIEDIHENHYVNSGKGFLRKVLATHKRNYRGNLVDIKVRKLGGVVSLTEDHEVFVVRPPAPYLNKGKNFYRRYKKYEENYSINREKYFKKIERYFPLMETSAGNVKVGDFVLYPINDRTRNLEKIDLRDYLTKKYTLGPRPKNIPYVVDINHNFLKLLGYWIAEGSNHRAYIRFNLGGHEEAFAAEIVKLIKSIFDLDAKIHRRLKGKKTGLEITACHTYLADIFENLCSKGAENKHIPFIFQELPPSKQMVLLEAIFKGDGSSFVAYRSTKRHKFITTISRVLAEQLVDVLLRNKFYPSLHIAKSRKDKLGFNHRESYSVFWSEEAKSQHNAVYYRPDGTKYWILPVIDTKKKKYSGPVYNLTVEKDHSYVAANFAVSNCGKGGDIFGFVKELEGVEFSEALRMLAQRAGVELKNYERKEKNIKDRLYEICETAAKFFEKQLTHSNSGQKALAYLKDRGLRPETIKEFRLGFAPNDWNSLTSFLKNCGYPEKEIIDSGVAIKRESPGSETRVYDRFRSRLTFPIFDITGKIVGFSGRIFESAPNSAGRGLDQPSQDVAKYINTPQTLIYDKSRILYGLDRAKLDIKRAGQCILVEGNMDVLMSHQAGVKNAVASSGTALTLNHLRLLRRYTDNLGFSFDTDQAGDMATKRAIGLALSNNFGIKIISIPDKECKDPADYVKKYGQKWSEVVSVPKPVIDFYFDKAKEKFDPLSVESKKSVLLTVAPFIKRLQSRVERSHWISQLAILLRTREDSVEADIMSSKDDLDSYAQYGQIEARDENKAEVIAAKESPDIISEALLSIVFKNPNLFKDELKDIPYEFIFSKTSEVIKKMEETGGDNFQFDDFVKNFEGEEAMHIEFAYIRSQELWQDFKDQELKAEFKNLVNAIKRRTINARLADLEFDIRQAENLKDKDRLNNLALQFTKLTNELAQIQKV